MLYYYMATLKCGLCSPKASRMVHLQSCILSDVCVSDWCLAVRLCGSSKQTFKALVFFPDALFFPFTASSEFTPLRFLLMIPGGRMGI